MIDRPTPEQQDLLQMAAIGKQLEDFFRTKAFEWLLDQAHDMKDAACNELAVVTPTDAGKIMELQRDIQVADRFEQWITEGIQAGQSAEHELNQTHPD